MDPLHPEPRDPALQRERNPYYGSDEKRLAEEQQRLSGHGWDGALKLVAATTPGDDDNDD